MLKDLSEIGLCYHPTSTVFVDDSKEYLISMGARLSKETAFSCYFYDDPKLALKDVNAKNNLLSFADRSFIFDEEESTFHHVKFDFDITSIHKEIYNPQRFSQMIDGIIDYGMPKMNGAEFCAQVKDPLFQKIMLTGEAEKEIAVELFNAGKINQFIMKNTPDPIGLLQKILIKTKKKYFLRISKEILNKLIGKPWQALSCLSDPAFITLFNEMLFRAKAVEYYLLDTQGSFLFLDEHGKPSWLIAVSEEEMGAYYQTAKYGEAPNEVVNALKNKTHLPYFPSEGQQRINPVWENYLYPANLLEGKNPYYYAYIENPKVHNIQINKILSYQSYRNSTYEKYLDGFMK